MAQSHGQAGTGSSGFGGCGKVPEDESAEEIAQIDTYNHDAALRLGQHGWGNAGREKGDRSSTCRRGLNELCI